MVEPSLVAFHTEDSAEAYVPATKTKAMPNEAFIAVLIFNFLLFSAQYKANGGSTSVY